MIIVIVLSFFSDQLRKLSWNGIPEVVRGNTWRLLSVFINLPLKHKTVII